MHLVNMHEAKSKLSSLVKEVLSGKEVVIAKAGKPLVKLIPFQQDSRPRVPGRYKNQIEIAPDFDLTSEDIIKAFEGQQE